MARKRKPSVEVRPLGEFRQDPDNTRLHPDRNVSALEASMTRFGAARSGVVDGDGVIRAGNGAVAAALERGVKEAVVVDVDGNQMVLVRRKDWTPEQAAAYGITDNKASDLSEFDYAKLAPQVPVLADAGFDLVELGWQDWELEPLARADWTPPPQQPGALDGGTQAVTQPVRLDREQRLAFEAAVASMRAKLGRDDMTEGEVLAQLAKDYVEGAD